MSARARALLVGCLAIWMVACDTASTPPSEVSEERSTEDDDDEDDDEDDAPAQRNDAGKATSKSDAASTKPSARDAGTDTEAGEHDDHPPAGDAGTKAPSATHDHCVDGESADPRDAELTGKPDQWKATNGAIDLVLPKPVLSWMRERVWTQSHDAWHNVRRCRGGFGGGNALCQMTELVPEHQECADAEDGYQFLVMHRHMMVALRQAFPEHTELFEGFPSFPYEAKDVPLEWQDRFGTGWSQSIKDTAKTLEDIENKLSQFPTEGDLGRFMQCGGMASGASSIHGALHFKWVVNSSPHSLGKQTVNIENYMFWKLHGWIDKIWERYRIAKKLPADEPKLQMELTAQCREMHTLGKVLMPNAGGGGPTSMGPQPGESGVFHTTVRPILEEYCSSCHSESSPEGGLTLGGDVSSAAIVKQLVGVASVRGGQFKRVVAGDASKSWLYLKVAGTAMQAGCQGMCSTQVMPPTGQVTLKQSELSAIQQWIDDGAPAP